MTLEQNFVSIKDYENSKYLYLTLKMRNLRDMNNLYNVQGVILLCEYVILIWDYAILQVC